MQYLKLLNGWHWESAKIMKSAKKDPLAGQSQESISSPFGGSKLRFGCSKTLRVEDTGQMRIRCRKRLDDAEGLYRSSSGRDISGNNIILKNKLKKNGGKLS